MAYERDPLSPGNRFCSSCGTGIAPGASFCPQCGTSVDTTSQPPNPTLQPPMAGSTTGHVPNYLIQAILATIFCCLPAGIVGIVFAAQVNGKLSAGDYAGAVAASRKAKTWCWVSFGVGLGLTILWVLIVVIGGVAGAIG